MSHPILKRFYLVAGGLALLLSVGNWLSAQEAAPTRPAPPLPTPSSPAATSPERGPTPPARKPTLDKFGSPASDAALESFLKNFSARCLGPAAMSGRITALAVDPRRPATIYVGSASGGLWRSTNEGMTWTPIFEKEGSSSIGHFALAPSNPDIIWIGTGEANARNSVTWGDGVYRSTDGGKTWQHRGLSDSHHIGKIVIHPRDPNTVYVAALGHFWGPNEQRGVFKTSDGGSTWQHVLNLGRDCGCVDLIMHPEQPDQLIAAAQGVRRDAFSGGDPAALQFHEQAGLYKTTDAGRTWTRLTTGLPKARFGRSGLDVFRRRPETLYAIIQTEKTNIRSLFGQGSRENSDPETGGVFRSDDFGDSWRKLNDLNPRPFYFSKIRVDPSDDQRVWVLGIPLFVSTDGGKNFRADGAPRVHADFHALYIDPANPERLIVGCDGGVYLSYDRGKSWGFCEGLPVSQFYAVAVDMRRPYWVYGGLQDNGSFGAPTNTRNGLGIGNHDWLRIGGGDGFYCQVDPADWTTVYAESQYGAIYRVNVATGETKSIRPPPPGRGVSVRYNWSAPIHLSPHNPRTVYFAGNYLFRSLDRGDNWQVISPDLTRGAPGTISTVAESPRVPGVIWVGSDDGKLYLTREGGVSWLDLSDRLPGPSQRHISRVEPSAFDAGTCYVAVDRHRNDDYRPYLYKTTDYGQTWQALHETLPANGSVHVVREDRVNRQLLYCGTEFGLLISVDGGTRWTRLRANLPTVAVHDLVVHPRERELVIATHGRGIWVMDVAPLQQLTPKVFSQSATLFEPKPAVAYRQRLAPNVTGVRAYFAPNPPAGAVISYFLPEALPQPPKVLIRDALGNTMADLTGPSSAGLHSVTWSLRQRLTAASAPAPGQPAPPRRSVLVPPGDYVVCLMVGGQEVMKKRLRVDADDVPASGPTSADDGDDEDASDDRHSKP
jgi:photosystem II stability/assembly factor-like uncharacterized protein